ncbi:hypothetical protein SAMN02745830_00724 [Streptomyces sp. Amel2xC10]|nr:hypothetical protein SAMN02745830_00724 [Streptomyces sp. Amel2xC10]
MLGGRAVFGVASPSSAEVVTPSSPQQFFSSAGDAPFTRLGLTEPETIASDLRKTSLCPEDTKTPEGRRLRSCVDIYAHDFAPGRTRIYVRSS